MRNVVLIGWKETRTYFASPTAYVVGVVFLALTGFFFVANVSSPFPEASTRGFLVPATFIMVLFAPIITMRLLAEEQKLGTLELLLTSPVRDYEVVLGKFLASMAIFLVALAFTLYYALLLYWYGDPDTGPLLSGYLGFLMYGAAALSVGILASSLTANQIVAAVLSFGLLLILTLVNQAADIVTGTVAKTVLTEIALTGHFEDFVRGVIDTSHIIYYVTFTAVFLFLAIRSLESRRWR